MIHGATQEGVIAEELKIYGIVGLSKAMDLAYSDLKAHQDHVWNLKSHMISQLKSHFDDIYFYGEIERENSLYTVLNVCFPKTEKASMLLFT